MRTLTRRGYLKTMLGAAAAPLLLSPQNAARADRGSRPVTLAVDMPIPPAGIGRGIRHLAYSDIGGRPDSVQIMMNRRHLYVGHMFSNGVTVLDAADPRRLKPVSFFTGGDYTRTHHLQAAEDLLLVANGANIVAMQSYDNLRGYFENALADSITNRKKFRSGLSIHDISRPAEMREIAFLEMPGLGINRLWWTGGRYAYVAAHFDGFTDHVLCIVDLKTITKPEIVSKWWLAGMNRAAGESPTLAPGRRVALHHMITAGTRGYGAWRDGGLTVHDVSDPVNPRLISHINWSPPFPGGTHTPLPLPGRNLVAVADEANAERCAKGTFYTWIVDVRAPEQPVTIATLPTPGERDFCSVGTFGPHNLHENRPGSFQSEERLFATYNNAGVRVFDIRDAFAPKEIASWVPPPPAKLIDPRPNVALAAKSADIYVTTDGLMFVSDWNAGLNVLQYEEADRESDSATPDRRAVRDGVRPGDWKEAGIDSCVCSCRSSATWRSRVTPRSVDGNCEGPSSMKVMSRRDFVAMTAAGTVVTPFMDAPSLAVGATRVTAQEVVDRIKANIGVEWRSDDVDTFKAGDPSTIVTGVVTTSMATLDVLQKAVQAGANLIITAAPTFYSRADLGNPAGRGLGTGAGPAGAGRGQGPPRGGASGAPPPSPATVSGPGTGASAPMPPAPALPPSVVPAPAPPSSAASAVPPDPVYAGKNAFIEKNKLVVFRLTQHWNQRTPDPRAVGLAAAMGWRPASGTGPRSGAAATNRPAEDGVRYEVPAITLDALASQLKKNLGTRGGVRAIGDRRITVRKIGLLPGYTLIQAAIAMLPTVDAVIAGEVQEWESATYAQDVAFAGIAKGFISIGRVANEATGMQVCADWLKPIVPEVLVRFISAGDPYWRPM